MKLPFRIPSIGSILTLAVTLVVVLFVVRMLPEKVKGLFRV